ncbi:MAG: hypothetical protein H0Z33_08365 [Bacillaceae bacterium]|nr:hypothetical protein [Bacillaceae bacterium]
MTSKKLRALTCFMIGLTLLFYAVPRLPFQGIGDQATGFSLIWLLFALLVVGANLHYALGVEYEEQRAYRKKQQASWWRYRMMQNRPRVVRPGPGQRVRRRSW